jgi:DNA-binding beta-propeller fold protein YncE
MTTRSHFVPSITPTFWVGTLLAIFATLAAAAPSASATVPGTSAPAAQPGRSGDSRPAHGRHVDLRSARPHTSTPMSRQHRPGPPLTVAAVAWRFDRALGRIAPERPTPFPGRPGEGGFGSSLVGSAPVGNGPGFMAVDPATHTLYVTNGFSADGNPDGGNTVSVIDERHCQADDVSRCKGPWPTLTVGSDPNANPSGVAIDQRTDTLYVADANDNSVSVFNGATCNAETSAGCGQTPAMVPVGMVPVAIFDDPANNTVYIPNAPDDDLSMLDSATCNATDLAACPTTPPPTVTVAGNPVAGAVDRLTHTVYVTGPNGVSVFDASTCNATVQSGCDQLGLLPTAMFPNDAQVDPANQTLYTANNDNTISAFDLADCNASDLPECENDTPGTVTLPPAPGFNLTLWVAVDPTNHSVYVTNQKDDSVMVVNANVCTGRDLAGCATLDPPEIHTGADSEVLTLDPATQTLYTANQVDNDVSVIDATRCDAQTTSGCRARVPEVPNVSGGLAVDPAVHTTYVASSATAVAMIHDSTCNAFHTAGCAQTPPSVTVGTDPSAVAVDPTTHTVYVANQGAGLTGTVTVFDDRSCNATKQTGCTTTSTLQVPDGNPVAIAVNPVTNTVYAATLTSDGGPDLISVFNGSTCNATTTSGCGQTPANAATGPDGGAPFASTESVAVNAATNTVYATSDVLNANPYIGDSVYVINGTTCDAADQAGCHQTPATVTLNQLPSNPFGIPGQQPNPFAIAVDPATDTIYTANIANGEGPGTVSIVNGNICNAHNTSGCDQIPATAPAGFGTTGIAVDPASHQVVATNIEDTSITTINGHACNAVNSEGCDRTQTQAIVGDYPSAISIDPAVDTAYVADSEGISLAPLRP